MQNVLVGNGFNLEIDREHTLSNRNIMLRVMSNLRQKDYGPIMGGKVTSSQLKFIFEEYSKLVRKILSGDYDDYIEDEDEIAAYARFRHFYQKSSTVYDIGIEDYFFIMRLESKSHNDEESLRKAAGDGLQWIFLDAIYNGGKSQHLTELMRKTKRLKFKNKFAPYDQIFTVNYDCNLDVLTEQSVFHLHGDFRTLLDQYIPGTVQEYAERNRGNTTVAANEWRHIYCNAIMGFCGPQKEKVQNVFNNFAIGVDQMKKYILSGAIKKGEDIIPFCTKLSYEETKYAVACVDALIKDINQVNVIYPSGFFKSIEGKLDIVGLSPNNDDHIWKAIRNNPNISDVRFFYKTEDEKNNAISLYGDMMHYLPVEDFWEGRL